MKRNSIWTVAVFSFVLFSACDSGQTTDNNVGTDRQQPVAAPQEQVQESPQPAAAAQDPDAEQMELVVENLKYSPNELKAKRGERIQVTLINEGEVETSVRFDLPGAGQELRTTVPPGQRGAIIFTVPEKAGTYPFYSPVRNQRDRGLTGQLVVE